MSPSEPIPLSVGVFLLAFSGLWFFLAYLVLCRPTTWIEWFLAKPWKPFGVAVSIVDEQKLKRRMSPLGLLYVAGGVCVVVFLVWAGVFSVK